jgi:CRP-like cAMP-binding protein
VPRAIRPITSNRLLSALPREVLDRLWPDLHRVSWSARQSLYEIGTPIEHVYFSEEGIASIIAIMADGSTSEVGMTGIEGVVGVSALLGAELSAQHVIVQLPGSALRMDAALCKAAFDRHPGFHALVLRFVDAFLNLIAQTAACNRLHSARQRCARWLLMASDRTGSETMPMTHEFLSSMLGVRRTGVTAIARELQRTGVIQYRHGQIRIIDRAGLEAVACECYRIDHKRFRRLL